MSGRVESFSAFFCLSTSGPATTLTNQAFFKLACRAEITLITATIFGRWKRPLWMIMIVSVPLITDLPLSGTGSVHRMLPSETARIWLSECYPATHHITDPLYLLCVERSASLARPHVPDPDNSVLGMDGQEAAVSGKEKVGIPVKFIVSERWQRRNQPMYGPKSDRPVRWGHCENMTVWR